MNGNTRRILDKEETMVYIPLGAEKGDCPCCYYGVLRRDSLVEEKLGIKEGYICVKCFSMFAEIGNRNFFKVDKTYKGRLDIFK